MKRCPCRVISPVQNIVRIIMFSTTQLNPSVWTMFVSRCDNKIVQNIIFPVMMKYCRAAGLVTKETFWLIVNQFVMTTGDWRMLRWSVVNWDFLELRYNPYSE